MPKKKKIPQPPDTLETRLERSKTLPNMVAVWHREGDTLHVYKVTSNFRRADFQEAIDLLRDLLNQELEDAPE